MNRYLPGLLIAMVASVWLLLAGGFGYSGDTRSRVHNGYFSSDYWYDPYYRSSCCRGGTIVVPTSHPPDCAHRHNCLPAPGLCHGLRPVRGPPKPTAQFGSVSGRREICCCSAPPPARLWRASPVLINDGRSMQRTGDHPPFAIRFRRSRPPALHGAASAFAFRMPFPSDILNNITYQACNQALYFGRRRGCYRSIRSSGGEAALPASTFAFKSGTPYEATSQAIDSCMDSRRLVLSAGCLYPGHGG